MNYFIDTEFWENGPDEPIRLIILLLVLVAFEAYCELNGN